jgi:DNA primase
LDKDDLLIICEGLIDIHKIWTGITKNVTYTFGTAITEEQKKFLQFASNLVLYVDDDSASHNSVNIFENLCSMILELL